MNARVKIAYVTDDRRAGSHADQLAAIKADGFDPEKVFEGDDLQHLPMVLRSGRNDVLAVATPKAFGRAPAPKMVLEACARDGVKVKLPGEEAFAVDDEATLRFLALAAQPWARASQKQRRSRGRPAKYRQPTQSQIDTILAPMWARPRTKDDPDGFTRQQVCDVASDILGWTVRDHHLKHWCGDKRGT